MQFGIEIAVEIIFWTNAKMGKMLVEFIVIDLDWIDLQISRESIDACKEHFRDDLTKTDWALVVELKKLFEIL